MKNYLSWEKKRFSLDHYINVIAQAKLYNGGVPDLEKSLVECYGFTQKEAEMIWKGIRDVVNRLQKRI